MFRVKVYKGDENTFFSMAENMAIATGFSYKRASLEPNDKDKTSTPFFIA